MKSTTDHAMARLAISSLPAQAGRAVPLAWGKYGRRIAPRADMVHGPYDEGRLISELATARR
jgi:hypothetical protein